MTTIIQGSWVTDHILLQGELHMNSLDWIHIRFFQPELNFSSNSLALLKPCLISFWPCQISHMKLISRMEFDVFLLACLDLKTRSERAEICFCFSICEILFRAGRAQPLWRWSAPRATSWEQLIWKEEGISKNWADPQKQTRGGQGAVGANVIMPDD